MYVTANLPPLYGEFNRIRRDNYPFRKAFERYLEAIASLGLSWEMDADLLVGAIEDALMGVGRLPDIPEGTEPVKFRFAIENGMVEEYFGGSELPNKTIVMLVIRMTLRLSERFGTSLSRLTRLISDISLEPPAATKEEPVVRHVLRALEKPQEPDMPSKPDMPPKPDMPGKTDVLGRLKDLTERGDALLNGEKGSAKESVKVETNPLLSEFFGG